MLKLNIRVFREAQKRLGLSNMALAVAVGVDKNTIERWRGRGNQNSTPQRHSLEKLVDVLGVALDQLTYNEKPKPPKSPPRETLPAWEPADPFEKPKK